MTVGQAVVVRLPADVVPTLRELAAREFRDPRAQAAYILTQALRQQEPQRAAAEAEAARTAETAR
jgi:hypothetical protein